MAEASAREALRLAPAFYAASNELGLILAAQGDRAGAREQFVASASIDPVAKPARVNLVRRDGWWLYLLCLLVTSPLLALTAQVKPAQTLFVGWIVMSVLVQNALLRWTPVSRWLQKRAVTKANKLTGRRRTGKLEATHPLAVCPDPPEVPAAYLAVGGINGDHRADGRRCHNHYHRFLQPGRRDHS